MLGNSAVIIYATFAHVVLVIIISARDNYYFRVPVYPSSIYIIFLTVYTYL